MRDWLFVASTPQNMSPELADAFREGRAAGIEESAARIESVRQERVPEFLRNAGLHSEFVDDACDDEGWADISPALARRYRAVAKLVRSL